MLRKVILLIGALCLVTVLGVVLGVWYVGKTGQTRIERHVAARLQRVANHFLIPQLSLGELDYQYPRTVVVRDARLTTPDGLDILVVDVMTLLFKEIPRTDRPLRLEQVTLEQPRVYVVDTMRTDGRVAGWSEFLKPDPDADATLASTDDPRVSDVFQMRELRLVNGHVIYEDRNAGDDHLPGMDLAGITAVLQVEPDEQGWYAVDTVISGPAFFSASLKGRLDLDALVMDLAELALTMRLERRTDEALPPFVQSWLQAHEVTGRLEAKLSGRFPLARLEDGEGQADVRVRQARAVMDHVVIDLQSVEGEVVLRPQRLVLRKLALVGYEGTATGRVSVSLDPGADAPLDAEFAGENLKLEQLIRASYGEEEDATAPPIAGRLTFATQLAGPWRTLLTHASGTGWLDVTEGSLARLRLLARLRRMVGMDVAPASDDDATVGRDTARLEWTYEDDRARFGKIEALTRWLALRGDGDLAFDGSIDLRLNGGPLERMQHAMGRIGDLFGKVTDKLVTYTVTGHIADPVIRVRPLGLGRTRDDTAAVPVKDHDDVQ